MLFAFVLFLLIWILIGDINLLQQNYIIPIDGAVWKGTVTASNIPTLAEKYYALAGYTDASGLVAELTEELSKHTSGEFYGQILNKTGSCVFDPIILAWMFGALAATILLPVILRLTKQVNWDVLPFTLAMSFAGFIFIITGLIPQTVFQGDNIAWLWLIRLVILFATFAVFFFSINAIVVSIMARSKYASQYINQLHADKLADDIAKQQSKEVVDAYIKQRDDNAITYIDVEEEVKKKPK